MCFQRPDGSIDFSPGAQSIGPFKGVFSREASQREAEKAAPEIRSEGGNRHLSGPRPAMKTRSHFGW